MPPDSLDLSVHTTENLETCHQSSWSRPGGHQLETGTICSMLVKILKFNWLLLCTLLFQNALS